jgi:hypothetical protein
MVLPVLSFPRLNMGSCIWWMKRRQESQFWWIAILLGIWCIWHCDCLCHKIFIICKFRHIWIDEHEIKDAEKADILSREKSHRDIWQWLVLILLKVFLLNNEGAHATLFANFERYLKVHSFHIQFIFSTFYLVPIQYI